MKAGRHSTKFAILLIILLSVLSAAFAEENLGADRQKASDLLSKLLSRTTSDDEWSADEKEFEALPANLTLPKLFPEVARGIPGGYSYAAYNCSEPIHDRKVPGWGEFCVANWLWCKQLSCGQRRAEVSEVLLRLWAQPITYYGEMTLLQGLCADPDAESRIGKLLADSSADVRLRTEAGRCLLLLDETQYHFSKVVTFAAEVPIRFAPPGTVSYSVHLRQGLFDALVSSPQPKSGIDPAVVRLGYSLLLDEAKQQRKAIGSGSKTSNYGQFIIADHLNSYLGTAFEPNRELSIYAGEEGNERFWHDTVVNALDWWSKHENMGSTTESGL